MIKSITALIVIYLTIPVFANNEIDQKKLLAMHKQGMDAHKNIGLEKWLNGFTDDYISANRGVISYPTPEEMKNKLRPYITSTKFEYYRDMVPPVVKVSQDGTLGWVIVQIEAKGLAGNDVFKFQFAWIELYAKKNGEWVAVGNVSNMKK